MRCLVSLLVILASTSAPMAVLGAQDVHALRAQYTIKAPAESRALILRGAAGAASSTPVAFGASWRDAFVGGGFQHSTRAVARAGEPVPPNGPNDGSIALAVGLGDANSLGMEGVLTALSTVRRGLGKRSALSLKAHRRLGRNDGIALGVEHGVVLGSQPTDGTRSWYAVVSHVTSLRSAQQSGHPESPLALSLSAGIGNGRFRRVVDIRHNREAVNVFGAAAVAFRSRFSVLAEYTGQDVTVGMSVVPFHRWPVVLTPTLADLSGAASRSPRLLLGVGLVLQSR